jgi:hypothetical protein|tara:strand:+ start:1104 stop:1217 length:114 start_codon:yes stop_codon:yes gene_type:complete
MATEILTAVGYGALGGLIVSISYIILSELINPVFTRR